MADSLATPSTELDRLNGLVASLRREHGNRVAELHARAQTMAALERETSALRVVADAARALVVPARGAADPLAPMNDDGRRVCVDCLVESRPFDDAIVHDTACAVERLRAALAEPTLAVSCAVVIPRGGKFAALRQVKRAGRIEVPGGKVQPGEHPEAAARREVFEEVGLHVTHLVPLFVGFDGVRFRAHVFLAQAIGELRSSAEGEALWATADELLEGSFGDFYSSSPAILLALGRNPFMTMPLGCW